MKAYPIVATEHLGADTVNFLKGLAAGCPAVLVREPTNSFDANAVGVWIDNRKVGYVPKKQNAVLAAFIDQTGLAWSAPDDVAHASPMAADGKIASVTIHRAIEAKFTRSPNSKFPMVEV